ncbi:MAG: hypothetical protein ACOYJH_06315 [Anaerovoracaceae bacterium]
MANHVMKEDFQQSELLRLVKCELERERRIMHRNAGLVKMLPKGFVERIKDKYERVAEYVTWTDDGKKKKRKALPDDPEQAEMIKAEIDLRRAIEKNRALLENNVRLLEALLQGFSVYEPELFFFPGGDNSALQAPGQILVLSDPERNASRNPFHPEKYIYGTRRGEKVRSKSEMMIADILFEKGIDYLSDAAIQIGQGVFYPDFQVKRADGRLVLWEHFGMLSDPAYVNRSYEKIIAYGNAGFSAGRNLIISSECEESPMTRDTVLEIIEKYELV